MTTRTLLLLGLTLSALFTPLTAAVARDWVYTVQRGDTLWTLSERMLLRRSYWRRLQVLNQVDDPRRLRPGSRLRIPADWLRMPPTEAEVAAVTGSVVVRAVDGAALALTVGVRVGVGATLRTGADGSVRLRFVDGSEVQIEPGSELVLAELASFAPLQVGRSRVELRGGAIEVDVPPDSYRNGSRFRVTTPAASLAVRGTRYRARITAPLEAVTEVLRGEVDVRNRVDRARLPALFGQRVPAAAPLPPPQRLLPPPPAVLPPVFERVPLVIPLPSQPGAVAYRVQIAADDAFTEIRFSGVAASGSQLVGPDLPDGDYTLRLRAVSADGVEGQDAVAAVRVNARPEPPLQIAPAAGDVARSAQPEFVWTEAAGVAGYRFQLAADATFAAPLISIDGLTAGRYTPSEPLAAGRYFWRVAVRGDGGDSGPYSDPIGFEVRPAPAAVEVPAPAIDGQGLEFAWRRAAPGQRYQFQLARDYWFSDLIVDEELDQPRIAVAPLPSDKYYLRVRVIDADGYRGEFGPRQELIVPLTEWWRVLIVPAVLLLAL